MHLSVIYEVCECGFNDYRHESEKGSQKIPFCWVSVLDFLQCQFFYLYLLIIENNVVHLFPLLSICQFQAQSLPPSSFSSYSYIPIFVVFMRGYYKPFVFSCDPPRSLSIFFTQHFIALQKHPLIFHEIHQSCYYSVMIFVWNHLKNCRNLSTMISGSVSVSSLLISHGTFFRFCLQIWFFYFSIFLPTRSGREELQARRRGPNSKYHHGS